MLISVDCFNSFNSFNLFTLWPGKIIESERDMHDNEGKEELKELKT